MAQAAARVAQLLPPDAADAAHAPPDGSRTMKLRLCTLLLLGTLVGCRDDPAGPVVAGLSCAQPDGSLQTCALELGASDSFSIELLATECFASGNTVRMLSPTNEVLTKDGCGLEPPVSWNFVGPFADGTLVRLEIVSARSTDPPALRATGGFPQWTLEYEDGGDEDFNDLVFRVTATPS
jgi:hypothetical protein